MGFYNDSTPMVPKYLFIVLNQPSSKKILKRPPPIERYLTHTRVLIWFRL